jgi:uncharacterized protein DUF4154
MRYFLQKKFALLSLLLLLFIPISKAQSVVNYAIQANIIYRCTKYIDWPDNKKSGDFIIGIIGESPLYDELKNFTVNKTVGNQKIIIKQFSSSSASFNCHILFIDEDESRSVKRIAAETAGTATLIFSESEGLAYKGSCINFIIVDDHLKLEINKTNIEKRNLNIASDLLKLGVIIK